MSRFGKYGMTTVQACNGSIPCLNLGNGGTGVAVVVQEDRQAVGLAFYKAPVAPVGSVDIGSDVKYIDLNAQLQLNFDNPDSIDVIVRLLLEAKQILKGEQNDTDTSSNTSTSE